MIINTRTLIDSANKLLSPKEMLDEAHVNSKDIDSEKGLKSRDVAKDVGVSNFNILKLQNQLRDLQASYTREQIRLDYLKNKHEEIHEDLKYEASFLFPEYKNGIDKEALTKDVSVQMQKLLHSLKSVQVEMENLYALNFQSYNPSAIIQDVALMQSNTSLHAKELDPERVAKLTRI